MNSFSYRHLIRFLRGNFLLTVHLDIFKVAIQIFMDFVVMLELQLGKSVLRTYTMMFVMLTHFLYYFNVHLYK